MLIGNFSKVSENSISWGGIIFLVLRFRSAIDRVLYFFSVINWLVLLALLVVGKSIKSLSLLTSKTVQKLDLGCYQLLQWVKKSMHTLCVCTFLFSDWLIFLPSFTHRSINTLCSRRPALPAMGGWLMNFKTFSKWNTF